MPRRINQFLVPFSITLLILALMSLLVHDLTLGTPLNVVIALIVLSLLNAVVLPIAIRLTLPLALLTLGILPLLFNALTVLLVAAIVPGFGVRDVGAGILVTFALTFSSLLASNSYIFKADRDRQRYNTLQRLAKKPADGAIEKTPGLILLEIDGLAEPILRRAINEGYMPTLANWLKSKTHCLSAWETSLPSQTSSMQAGILHGTHKNIPGFRYYDRVNHRVLVSNHASDAADMMDGNDNGNGLLKEHGYSLNNWTTGDASEALLTYTIMADTNEVVFKQSHELYSFFAQPYNIQRVLIEMGVDMAREVREALSQRIHNVQPRVERRFPYPIYRASTTRLFPYLSCELIVGKMFEGISAAYTTFLNYDVVAHHSGIDRPDAMRILRQLDDQIRFITQAAQYASRPYEFVILSDHGQSMGATFKQRAGMNLAEVVNKLEPKAEAELVNAGKEMGVGHINMLLSFFISGTKFGAKLLQRLLRRDIDKKGHVTLDPARRKQKKDPSEAKTVVCPSGNLAHIYFTDYDQPLTVDQINSHFPKLVKGLAAHDSIGFVIARNPDGVPLVLGKDGAYNLKTNEVFHDNPLKNFGDHAADHLRELMTYPNSGDIVVNSLYNPQTHEVAAFEELVGSHGGLGGMQNQPFILYPLSLSPQPFPPQVGAPSLYKLFQSWQARLKQPGYKPTQLPAPQPPPKPAQRPIGVTVLAVLTVLQGLLTLAPNVPILMGFSILLTWQQNPEAVGLQSGLTTLLHLLTIPLLILAGINLWRQRPMALDSAIAVHATSILVGTINLLSQPPATRDTLPTFVTSITLSLLIMIYLLYSNRVRRAFAFA